MIRRQRTCHCGPQTEVNSLCSSSSTDAPHTRPSASPPARYEGQSPHTQLDPRQLPRRRAVGTAAVQSAALVTDRVWQERALPTGEQTGPGHL